METKAIQKEENVIWEEFQVWDGRRKISKRKIAMSAEDSYKNRNTWLKNSSLWRKHQFTSHTILSSFNSVKQSTTSSLTYSNPLRHN